MDLGFPCTDVYSFDRVSDPSQVQGRGLKRQGLMAQDWCSRHGLELRDERRFADPGKSAFHGKHIREGSPLSRFMDMAERRLLGEHPVLLVEEVDRLTRLAPMDGLQNVLFRLINQGQVTIVTLADGSFYNAEVCNSGQIELIKLLLYVQAAHDYSKRLSRRQSDNWVGVREEMEQGIIKRKKQQAPSWVTWDKKSDQWVFNEKAAVVRRACELLRLHGYSRTAKILNDEGHSPLSKRSKNGWNASSLSTMIRNRHFIYGAVKIRPAGAWKPLERGPANQSIDLRTGKGQVRGGTNEPGELIRDVFPAILPEQEVNDLAVLINGRDKGNKHTGPYTSMHYIGRGITQCKCGGFMSTCVGGHPPKRLVRYVACRKRSSSEDCRRPYLPIESVLAVLLSRLTADQLAHLDGKANHGADGEKLKRELNESMAMEAKLHADIAQMKQNIQNAATLDPTLFATVAASVGEKIQDTEKELRDVRAATAAIRADLSKVDNPYEISLLEDVVNPLKVKLLTGESTLEERVQVNSALKQLGIGIHIDSDEMMFGLSLNGGEIDWQRMDVPGAYDLLGVEYSGVTYIDASTDSSVNIALKGK